MTHVETFLGSFIVAIIHGQTPSTSHQSLLSPKSLQRSPFNPLASSTRPKHCKNSVSQTDSFTYLPPTNTIAPLRAAFVLRTTPHQQQTLSSARAVTYRSWQKKEYAALCCSLAREEVQPRGGTETWHFSPFVVVLHLLLCSKHLVVASFVHRLFLSLLQLCAQEAHYSNTRGSCTYTYALASSCPCVSVVLSKHDGATVAGS